MPAPAIPPSLPPMPSAPAGAPASEASPSPFDQHLQAARNAQSADTPPAANSTGASSAPRPDAAAQGDASPADDAGKPAQESTNMPTLASPAAPSAANSAPAAGAPSTTAAQADASLIETALAMAQAAPAGATATADAAAAKPATAAKVAEPGDEAAASLAGAMLAMLGQITGAAKGAFAAADGDKVSADGAASGRGKAGVDVLQGATTSSQANSATGGAPVANLANALGNAIGTPGPANADTHKDRALDGLALATSPAPAATPTVQAPAASPVQLSSSPGSAGFAGELGQQVVWFAQQGVQQAKVRLHPEDLGSLDVKLSVSHGRVDVVFSAQHPAAVTAVQQSLPQLDHLLSQHGLALGHAEVGQQQSHGHGHARGDGDTAAADEAGNVQGAASVTATASRVGLLDAFA